jgi:uncharacterized membrane protein
MVVLIVAVVVAIVVVVAVAVSFHFIFIHPIDQYIDIGYAVAAIVMLVTGVTSATVELQKYFIISDPHYIKHVRHSLRVLHYQQVCGC